MVIKKYLVSNMNEAMRRIRQDLGVEAIIISERKVRQVGIKGLFGKKMIEVTAARDNKKKKEVSKFKETKSEDAVLSVLKAAMSKNMIDTKSEEISKIYEPPKREEVSSELHDEVREMKAILNKIAKNQDEGLKKSLRDEDVLDEIIEKVFDGTSSDEVAKERISKIIKEENSGFEGITVLVGPTGVGKTTTIAKLAGRLSLIENKKVGLITVDTYRIGAVEQLKTYAQIMNIPFEVVINIQEMEVAIKNMKDCDVILIDTTGRSSKNIMQISELRAFVEKANADNISLVVSATTKNKDLKLIIDAYKQLKYKDIIVTKIDETASNGTILNIAHLSEKAIRYITTGQGVPNDIENCSSKKIISEILGETSVC
ncbi:flagellar biosynthesis protein FlhF [uncultured Clostridium sp.]|jgi:flagellar biosynthesis protein FlhF|uniref:flagellar biosynthesis protein FlhF n=1 Tax=uncultured Clostridium sp. TaxID=59620 RepID=UPI002603581A|nr:flagellar biosynthesis protein FlhF [uncultured Clostridium sp.]